MILMFTLAFNPDTKEAAWTGNLDMQTASKILQDVIVAELVKKAQEKKDVLANTS